MDCTILEHASSTTSTPPHLSRQNSTGPCTPTNRPFLTSTPKKAKDKLEQTIFPISVLKRISTIDHVEKETKLPRLQAMENNLEPDIIVLDNSQDVFMKKEVNEATDRIVSLLELSHFIIGYNFQLSISRFIRLKIKENHIEVFYSLFRIFLIIKFG
uniref:Uncharacterized protein n=1 Tax=Heterorhabditis bacteriophora TaxID=37862 RepID=A0A1I7WP69_HETBA